VLLACGSKWVIIVVHNGQCRPIDDNQAFNGPEREREKGFAVIAENEEGVVFTFKQGRETLYRLLLRITATTSITIF